MGRTILVTGSSGLVGSEICSYFAARGFAVHGVDNNQRAAFFGPEGDTSWNRQRLERDLAHYVHHDLDVRNRTGLMDRVRSIRPAVVVHCAAQPSHDRAAAIPFADFDTNAVGTLNLLEAAREHCPESPFVYMSTNKVYGDRPNTLPMREAEKRWEFADPAFAEGVSEDLPIDQSLHSLFGASKAAADLMVQEYGRYFGMPTCCLRGGCMTGPNHSGVELHGFLSYLVRCNLEGREYRVRGYKGKQVRDNIHSLDVARFVSEFSLRPRPGVVYNLGGGKANSCSILEAFEMVEAITGRPQKVVYDDCSRKGDHICYYSNLRRLKVDYPAWDISVGLDETLRQLVDGWRARLAP